jgi:hypothetical protein
LKRKEKRIIKVKEEEGEKTCGINRSLCLLDYAVENDNKKRSFHPLHLLLTA